MACLASISMTVELQHQTISAVLFASRKIIRAKLPARSGAEKVMTVRKRLNDTADAAEPGRLSTDRRNLCLFSESIEAAPPKQVVVTARENADDAYRVRAICCKGSRQIQPSLILIPALLLSAFAATSAFAQTSEQASAPPDWLTRPALTGDWGGARSSLADKGVTVEGCWFFAGGREIGGSNANWRAEHAVFQLSR